MKKCLIILIQVIICYFICEISCFMFELYRAFPYCGDGKDFKTYVFESLNFFKECEFVNFNKYYEFLEFKPVAGIEYTLKKPIILFGCSFVHGVCLENNQTFSFKLSKKKKSI